MTELKQEKKKPVATETSSEGENSEERRITALAASFDRGDDIFRLRSLEPKEAAAAYRERCVQNRP